MPHVGKKKFAYTDAGKEAAFEYAQKTGEPIMDVNQFGEDMMAEMKPLTKKKKAPKPYNTKMGMMT